MTLAERITETQARAARLYLQRQSLEASRQAVGAQIAAVEQSMLKTDGELELLDVLSKAEAVPSGV